MVDSYNKDHEKNEAKKFGDYLTEFGVKLYDENDKIWNEIIDRTNQIKNIIRIPEYSNAPSSMPFIQGDVKGVNLNLPDIIYNGKDYVLGIECFGFDSSKKTKKGSVMCKNHKAALDELNRNISEIERTEVSVDVQTEFSFKNYIDSLLLNFNSHVKNISKYKKALSDNFLNKKILFAFFIEDTTILGNYIQKGKETKELNPLFLKPFIDLVSQHLEIDYIITCYQDEIYVPSLYIQKIDEDNLKKLYENSYGNQYLYTSIPYKLFSKIKYKENGKNTKT